MTMLITVKVILIVLSLQAYKLAFYSFMDAGRGQRLLRSETQRVYY